VIKIGRIQSGEEKTGHWLNGKECNKFLVKLTLACIGYVADGTSFYIFLTLLGSQVARNGIMGTLGCLQLRRASE